MNKNSPNYWLIGIGAIILFIICSLFSSMADCPTCIGIFGILLIPIALIGIVLVVLGLLRK